MLVLVFLDCFFFSVIDFYFMNVVKTYIGLVDFFVIFFVMHSYLLMHL